MFEIIRQAFELTKQMLAAVEQNNWDEVQRLQLARQQLMQQSETLPAPTDKPTSERISQLVIAMQEMNTHIAPLLQQRRQALIKESLQNNKGRKMAKAYKTP
ncbi:flagellar protein FliT [Amphritea sp.]|uniref:flagellar protein FliT n=1 Tax=Amphritea sp. TaxID=1872502 RepID=UPI003A92748D